MSYKSRAWTYVPTPQTQFSTRGPDLSHLSLSEGKGWVMGSGNLCASCYQLDKEQILGRLNLKWLGSGLVRGEGVHHPMQV